MRTSRRKQFALAGALSVLLASLPGTSEALPGISLLKDLYPGPVASLSSAPSGFAELGADVLFQACDSEHGCELWKTDDTAGGTVLVADLWKGEGSGVPVNFAASGSKVFFTARDGIHGDSIWATDGTEAGTRLLLRGSRGFYDYVPMTPLPLGSVVITGTDDLVAISNSTLAVSVLLPGAAPWKAAAIGGTALVFSANTGSVGNLYKTDGTIPGTQLVTTVPSMISPPSAMTAVGSSVFFAANVSGQGRELWISDATAGGTLEVKDIRPGSSSSSPSSLTALGPTLYFTADDGTNGIELWKSDGTALGTTLVKNINPGSASSSPTNLVVVGSTLYFVATDGATGREIWKSDGSPGGTVRVADLVTGAGGSSPAQLIAFGTSLVFFANDGVHGLEPWISDGSGPGTIMIDDFNAGAYDGVKAALVPQVIGGTLYLGIDNGASGFDPWLSDGTAGGTFRIADLAVAEGDGRMASYEGPVVPNGGGCEIVSLSDWAVFAGFDPATGWEIWRTDGTPAGTTLLADISPGPPSSSPQRLTRIANRVYFFANDGAHGQELWLTDGTPGGTGMVADLAVGGLVLSAEYQHASPWFRGRSAAALNSFFLFAADAGSGEHLWRSDGSALGTVDLTAVANWDFGAGIGILGGKAYVFPSSNSAAGNLGVWSSDGSPGGTGLVVPNSPALDFQYAEGPVVAFAQRLYLDAISNSGYVLAGTDGTVAGSGVVIGADSEYRTALGTRLVFANNDLVHGYEPWTTDGTPGGTALLADILPGLSSSAAQAFTELGGNLFFAADDGSHGVELWRTDGTGPGTQLFLDIAPGLESSAPRCLTELGGILYFAAYRPSEGDELWRTDGTVLGTALVGDLAVGAGSSSPCGFVRVGGKVIFTAWDSVFGRELRVIDDIGQILAPASFEDGTLGDWSLFLQ